MGHLPWGIITSKLSIDDPLLQLMLRLGIGGRTDTEQATKWYEKVCQLSHPCWTMLMSGGTPRQPRSD